MENPRMLWLMITNLALGVVVVVGLATATCAILHEVVTRAQKRARLFAALDVDLCRLLSVKDKAPPETRCKPVTGGLVGLLRRS
jgi:hypothetical protein